MLRPAVFAIAVSLQVAAHASEYPARQIRIVVPTAPGGITGGLVQLIGEGMRAAWGQAAVMEHTVRALADAFVLHGGEPRAIQLAFARLAHGAHQPIGAQEAAGMLGAEARSAQSDFGQFGKLHRGGKRATLWMRQPAATEVVRPSSGARQTASRD